MTDKIELNEKSERAAPRTEGLTHRALLQSAPATRSGARSLRCRTAFSH